ncbi:reverse transcriptase domain-containing protein [Tanacetum coccineum]
MSMMANATPIVTTVTKTTNKEKAPDAVPRVNIQDFYEENYEDILPIIKEKARCDKRKEAGPIRESPLTAEVIPIEAIPTLGNVPKWKIVPAACRGKVNPHHPADQKAIPVTKGTGSQGQKGVCYMFKSTLIGAARVWFDELPPESIDGYKGLKAAFLAYFVHQKKYVKDPVEIHNIKQRDGETIEDFMERFKVETGRIKGALECKRSPSSYIIVNNTNKQNVSTNMSPKDPWKEMRAITTAFIIRGEAVLISPYNGIIGRPGIREIEVVPSIAHEMLKFPADGRIVTIRSTILIPAECATVITSPKEILKRLPETPQKAIQAEVYKLVAAQIMREVYYHDWLSNPVMVKKHDGSWRMCVDFTDLNKACPQDCYPLPEIDWKIESLCGYPFKCFLDSYKGYHQIQMAESDEEKMAFHTSQKVLLRRLLKNTGAINQRLVDRAFDSHVGRNMEVYVNDLVIKSHTEAEMVRDIGETFRTLRKINMKLNPKKCTFGAVEGMFLGYTITPEGIKPFPDKTEAVLQLPSLRMIKEV